MTSTSSGSSWMVGRPGTKANAPPPIRSATAGGSRSRSATYCKTSTASNMPMMSSNV